MKAIGRITIAVGALGLTTGIAEAADLPFAEPVEYVRVCDTYGAGFFYIPGTDTCLQISALLRVDLRYEQDDFDENNNDFITDTRGRVRFDARTETGWGTLRSFIEFEGRSDGDTSNSLATYPNGTTASVALRQGYVQFAGITAGKVARSFFDFVPYRHVAEIFSDEQVNTAVYTADFGDVEATVGFEDKYFRAFPSTSAAKTLDQVWPNAIAALAVKRAWGVAQISAAIQDNEGDFAQAAGSDEIGWAVQGGLAVNLPTAVAGSKIWIQSAYTEGALSYIGAEDFVGFRNDSFGGANFRDQSSAANVFLNTEAWSSGAGFAWSWSPTVQTNVGAIYVDVDQAFEDDFNFLFVEANTYWTPIPGLSLALALQYRDLDVDTVVAGGTATPAEGDHWGVVTRIERSF